MPKIIYSCAEQLSHLRKRTPRKDMGEGRPDGSPLQGTMPCAPTRVGATARGGRIWHEIPLAPSLF